MNRIAYSDEAPILHTLPNGMTVCMEHLPYLHSASTGLWIRAGSADENARIAGISHFLEHLFFKGTTTKTTHDIMDAIEGRGGHLNAFTSRDYTCLYARTLDTHVATAIDILADILRNSTFFEMDKERNVILEEIASLEDVPEDHVHDLFMEHLWPDHPLGYPIAGSQQTVSGITLDDVHAYFSRIYRPDTVIFSIAGNFDEKAVLEQVTQAFGDWPAVAPANERTSPQAQPGTHLVRRKIAQDHLCFGFPGTHVTDDARYTYEMLGNILGGGSTSRLFERIREDEGLAYSIYSFYSSYARGGAFGVYAAIAPENLRRTLELCFEEIRRLRDTPIPEDEVNNNREQLKGAILMALESTFHRMARMARSMTYFGRVLSVNEIIDAVDAVGPESLQKLAQDIFTAEQCTMTVLGPVKREADAEVHL
jgi:predicted Zn-dependent peptidase